MNRNQSTRRELGRASKVTLGATGAHLETMGLYTKWGLAVR